MTMNADEARKTIKSLNAVGSPVVRPVRPSGWAHRYSPQGLLHGLCDTQDEAKRDVARVGGTAHVVALYDQAALDAAVAAERERMESRVEEAFREGFYAARAYNDTVLNTADEAWEEARAGLCGPNAKQSRATRPAQE